MIQGFSGGLLNRELIYQTDLPSFQRDFASLKTLDHGTGPAITFTRASDATYFDADGVLQTAANDTPRFDHDPATGASRGLLIEEARTNTIIQSEDLSTTWAATGITVTTNQTTAPDGTSNADLIETTLTNVAHNVSNTQTFVAGAYTFSVFAKYEDHQWITLRIGVGGDTKFATFDIQNAVTGTATAGVTHSIISVGGGWYRLVMTATLATAGSQGALIILNDADDLNNTAYTGTGTGLYLWGAQLEEGAFPTSYIPTTTAAATRATEVAEITSISSFYNQSEGTIFAEGSVQTSLNLPALVSIDNSTADERLQLRRNDTSSQGFFTVADGGVAQAGIQTGSWTTSSQVVKMAAAYKVDDFAASFGGGAAATDTSGTIPTPTRLQIGRGISAAVANSHIRKIAYWPRRLSNTLLEQLTT
jgi:hypothetical protein